MLPTSFSFSPKLKFSWLSDLLAQSPTTEPHVFVSSEWFMFHHLTLAFVLFLFGAWLLSTHITCPFGTAHIVDFAKVQPDLEELPMNMEDNEDAESTKSEVKLGKLQYSMDYDFQKGEVSNIHFYCYNIFLLKDNVYTRWDLFTCWPETRPISEPHSSPVVAHCGPILIVQEP